MASTYSPRQMPRRFMDGAPAIVRREVIDIIAVRPAAPLDFDIVFRTVAGDGCRQEMAGLDFGNEGSRGCHFFLNPHEMRAYRERNRRKRVAWRDLPAATQRAIVRYLEMPE